MSKLKLYPYQESAVQNAVQMLNERGNSLIVAGTGAGKTIMMAAAIGRFWNGYYTEHKRKPHILVLVHRTEIHGQNHKKFSFVCPEIETSEITATRKSLHGYVHFGMIQTVINLLPDFENAKSFFDLIVIDEAHHAKASTYEQIIDWNNAHNPAACLLGVTATPNRGDKLPLIHLFDNYNQITSKFLIDSHYLVRPTFKDFSLEFQTSNGIVKGHLSSNIKDDEKGRELIRICCAKYLESKLPGKTIIFAPSHTFCKMIFDALKSLDRNPAYLSLGLDDMSRQEEISKFENGDCDELINVDICTEGYDYPKLANIVDFDTNGTQGQWIQKVGRVLRTAPQKTNCCVIDFGGNICLYPNGVETDVNLDGIVKKEKGQTLTEEDLFIKHTEKRDSETNECLSIDSEKYTPYTPHPAFETVLDKDLGIVFVACSEGRDCIICEDDGEYLAFVGDKFNMSMQGKGSFEKCTNLCLEWIGVFIRPDKPINNIQIRLLAPDYATTALDYYGANCCICWKTWKEYVLCKLK